MDRSLNNKTDSPPRILVVEDEPIVLIDTAQALEGFGYLVVGAVTSGAEAVTRAAELDPDIILMDIVLPGDMNGIEAARVIRSRKPIPIIYMTANADASTVESARDTEPSGYVLKPVSVADLHSNIESSLYKARMEQRLRESEARFRSLFHYAGEGILVAELESKRFIYANPSICALLGYAEEELLKLSVLDIHPHDQIDLVLSEFARQGRKEKVLASNIPCLRKDGSIIYADINTTPMVLDNRECNVGFFTDITGRKAVEEALRENEAKYRRLIETTDTGFVIVDGNGVVYDANATYVRMTGHEMLEQILGRSVIEWTAEHDRERNRHAVEQCFSEGSIRGFEVEYIGRDGGVVPIEINATVVGAGDDARILTLCRDITERLRAARALRESEERFRLAAVTTGQLVYDYTITTGSIEWMGGIEDITGFTPEEMQAVDITAWEEMIHPDDRTQTSAALEHSINSGTHFSVEYRFRIKSGAYVDMEDVGAFIPDQNGVPYRMIGTMKDITARKRAARELAETSNRLENILSITRTGIDIIDADYNLRYVDPGWQKIYGDPTGRKCYEYFMDRAHPCSDCGIPQAITTRQITITEETLPREGNRVIEVHTIPFQSSEGEWLVAEFNVDITARKKAEVALRTSEEKFLKAFNGNPTLMAISTIEDGRFVEVNQSFLDKLGFTRDEVIGKTSGDLGIFDDISKRDEILSALARDGFAHDFDVVVHARSGATLNGSFSAEIIELGDERYLLTVMNDITARKQAEAALRESEARFSAFMENLPVLALIKDSDLRPVYANSSYRSLFPADDWMGKTPHEIFPPEIADLMVANDCDALRKGYVRYEEQWTDRTGVQHVFETYKFRIERSEKEPLLGAIIMDVTARKQAGAALERERNQFISGPMVAFKWRAEPGWPQEYVSPNVARWGYDPGLFIDNRIAFIDILHPDDRARVEEEVARYTASGAPAYEQEYRIHDAAGRVRWVHDYTVVVRNESGVVTHYDGYLTDVTERKHVEDDRNRLEEQLRQSQRIESIGRLAGGVAHDFNNLLTAITGNISLALMDLAAGDPLTDTLKEAMKAAESAAALTRQLLAFSRKQMVEPRIVNLNDLIVNMKKMLVRIIGEDISLKTLLSENPGVVKIDPGQFEQIVINLTVNARDAMPDGGELIVETVRIDLDAEYVALHPYTPSGPYVMISVSDTGSGMPDEVQEHLYEPFYTTKPQGKGTGLGLATIYGAVKQNGGSIEVYSKVGMGTTFKIYFPRLAEAPELPLDAKNNPTMPAGTETILLVEDEQAVRELAERLLRRLGYRLLSCGNGPDALTTVRGYEGDIHLMITDVIMPGMNGLELSRQVETLRPAMKVLFTSGYSEEVIAHHGIIDRGLNFIAKPYRPEEFAKKIRSVLDGD